MGNTKYGKIDTKRKLLLHIKDLGEEGCKSSIYIDANHCHNLCIISKDCPIRDYEKKVTLLMQKGLEQNIITEEDIFEWKL